MPGTKGIIYAVVGAGDFAVDKVRNAGKVGDVYADLVARGRDLTRRIGRAAPTQQAVERTRTARSQAKAAATSVRKAVKANATAARSAAGKAAKAS